MEPIFCPVPILRLHYPISSDPVDSVDNPRRKKKAPYVLSSVGVSLLLMIIIGETRHFATLFSFLGGGCCDIFKKVSSPKMIPLFSEANAVAKAFEELNWRHIERALNDRADTLANLAMDAGESSTATSAAETRILP